MSEVMSYGVDLAIYGMGTVFVFLTLLVLATMLMSRLVGFRADEEAPARSIDAGVLAAIAAAVRRYRDSRRS